ncbi:unnamed protein product [Ilex paraguariensis]|uniref:Small auxin up regulated protein n=1 Tax=Ilex paraguariensis TaxID=185542 RepID=A0ABC8U9J2_9AQUA
MLAISNSQPYKIPLRFSPSKPLTFSIQNKHSKTSKQHNTHQRIFSLTFLHFLEKMSACSKIRHIVRIGQMLRRWRKKAAMNARRIPSDVPAGHVAVTVGTNCRRFVVRATYLNHPVFKKLLVQAEEEYGFTNTGPLVIPCDESVFEEILRFLSRSESSNSARFMNLEDFHRHCHVGLRSNLEFWPESRPLLGGFTDKSIC